MFGSVKNLENKSMAINVFCFAFIKESSAGRHSMKEECSCYLFPIIGISIQTNIVCHKT